MGKVKFLSLLFLLGLTTIACKPDGGASNSSGINGGESEISTPQSSEESSSSETRYPVNQQSYDQQFEDFDVTNETSTNAGRGGTTW